MLARPQRVAGAVLLDSYGLMPRLPGGRQVLAWAMQRTGALDLATRAMATNSAALAWSLKSLIRDPAQRTPELVAEIVAAARQPGFTAFEQWQRNEMLWNRLRTDYTKRLADIARPVLIVHGDRDVGVPVARARGRCADPARRVESHRRCRHWVQRDQPEAVVAVMTDFLRRVLASQLLDSGLSRIGVEASNPSGST